MQRAPGHRQVPTAVGELTSRTRPFSEAAHWNTEADEGQADGVACTPLVSSFLSDTSSNISLTAGHADHASRARVTLNPIFSHACINSHTKGKCLWLLKAVDSASSANASCQVASVGSAMPTLCRRVSRDILLIHRVETVVHRGPHFQIQLSGNYLENALGIVRHGEKLSARCTSSLRSYSTD